MTKRISIQTYARRLGRKWAVRALGRLHPDYDLPDLTAQDLVGQRVWLVIDGIEADIVRAVGRARIVVAACGREMELDIYGPDADGLDADMLIVVAE